MPTLRQAATELALSHARGEPLRCMGCGTLRHWPKWELHVLTYTPRDPTHWPLAYAACAHCLADPARRHKLFRWAETRSRAAGEGEG
jgi:hypothetical protein